MLVEPATAGNIGAVARVLKNTGIGRLCLVNPGDWDTAETRWMAHGSEEILDSCSVFPDLPSALRDTHLVIGTTHRTGRAREVDEDYRTTLRRAVSHAHCNQLAIVFGRERDGLWMREIEHCHWLLRLPAAVAYPSFNLSHAVLLVTYELFTCARDQTAAGPADLATAEQTERVIENVLRAMAVIEFQPYNEDPNSFARVLRRFLTRTPLDRRDAMVVHRVCGQIRKFANRHLRPPQNES